MRTAYFLIEREMNWHLQCPIEHGYPRFVYTTFMDGNYDPLQRSPSFIPCPQNGMGIISYLKYCAYSAKANPKVPAFARAMGDYLVKETLTPATGKYPRFTRSTGWRAQFPFPRKTRIAATSIKRSKTRACSPPICGTQTPRARPGPSAWTIARAPRPARFPAT